jgi:hypothetical protein
LPFAICHVPFAIAALCHLFVDFNQIRADFKMDCATAVFFLECGDLSTGFTLANVFAASVPHCAHESGGASANMPDLRCWEAAWRGFYSRMLTPVPSPMGLRLEPARQAVGAATTRAKQGLNKTAVGV